MFGSKMGAVEKAASKKSAGKLIELCKNKDKQVSMAAIAALGTIGGDEAANYLVSILQSTKADVRIAVANALGAMGDKHTKAFLSAQMGKETDADVRSAISNAMSQIQNY